jgi:hypothetical protein
VLVRARRGSVPDPIDRQCGLLHERTPAQ